MLLGTQDKDFFPEDEIIKKFRDEIMRLNSDTKFIREISEEEEKIMISKQEGQTQGYNDGKKDGIMEVIKNLIKLKMPIKTIAIATDLTEEEVKKRIKEFKLEE